MGVAQLQQGGLDDAIKSFRLALESANDDCTPFYGLKVTYMRQGRSPVLGSEAELVMASKCPIDDKGGRRARSQVLD